MPRRTPAHDPDIVMLPDRSNSVPVSANGPARPPARTHSPVRRFTTLLALAAGCAAPRPSLPTALLPRPDTFPLDGWNEPITIPVVVAGRPCCFLLDTGCTLNAVDPAFFPGLRRRRPTTMRTAGDTIHVQLFDPPAIDVGPFPLDRAGQVVGLDCAPFRALSDKPIVGILGIASLADAVVQIDFDRRRLTLMPPDTRPHPDWGSASTMTPSSLDYPTVTMTLAGTPQSLTIDTGYEGFLSLPPLTFDRLRQATSAPSRTTRELTAGGVGPTRTMRVPSVDLGATAYENASVDEDVADADAGLVLGLTFLERHLATLDFPNRRFYLKPGLQIDRPAHDRTAGFAVSRPRDDLVILDVTAGGPAADAGLRVGDVLVELDGKPAAAYRVPDVSDLLAADHDRTVAVVVRRASATVRVTVPFRRPTWQL